MVVPQPDDLRASDADRERVADRLRASLNEGRLDLSEFDERVAKAYAARTYGDLKTLLTDLPDGPGAVVPSGGTVPVPVDVPSGHTRQWLAGIWSGWISAGLITTVIWFATGAGYFWPFWVIGPWGAILVATTVSGLMSGEPRKKLERERRRSERRAVERQERHEQRAIEHEHRSDDMPTDRD